MLLAAMLLWSLIFPLATDHSIQAKQVETVTITGYVRSPGVYEWQPDMTVRKFIAVAGGVTNEAATDRLSITRKESGKNVQVPVKLDDAVLVADILVVPRRRP